MPGHRIGGVRWWTRVDAPPDLEARIEQTLAAWREGRLANQKRGRRKALYPVSWTNGAEPDALLKVNEYSGSDRVRRALLGSKARREMRIAERLLAAGVPTPAPLAAGEERHGPQLVRDLLLLPFVPGARDLRVVSAELGPGRERVELARELGQLTGSLENAGVFQEDFAPNNFLVCPAPGPRLQVIDFERARIEPASEARLAFALAKLDRELPESGAAERRALLSALRPDPAQARALWHRVEDEVRELAVRDHERLRRVVGRPGRRFGPLELGQAKLLARKGLDAAQLEAAVAGHSEGWLRDELPPMGPAVAADLMARAVLLHHRGLGPEPQAVARLPESAIYLARRPAASAPPTPAAVRRLERRLGSIGVLRRPLEEAALVGADAGQRALLLDPYVLRVGARPGH